MGSGFYILGMESDRCQPGCVLSSLMDQTFSIINTKSKYNLQSFSYKKLI